MSDATRARGSGWQRTAGFGLAAIGLALLSTTSARADEFLTAADVNQAIMNAAQAISPTTQVIAVVDREGIPLGVFRKAAAPATVVGNFGVMVDANDAAVGLARTGAFFSNNQAPLSSRTVRFISGIHFPPGVRNKPNAALYGIENSNRGCSLNVVFIPGQEISPATSLNGSPCHNADQTGCGTGIMTGKPDLLDSSTAVNPGGVPIFKNGQVVGGIGVTGVPSDQAEFAAFVGSLVDSRFGPRPASPGVIYLDGVRLPFVNQTTRPRGVGRGVFAGAFVVGPIDSPAGVAGVPRGWLVGPLGNADITAGQVSTIVARSINQANRTRAAIRLPLGSRTRMMIAVTGLAGEVLGLFRMPDATIFSIDVAVAKARNVTYFSGATRAATDLLNVPRGTAVTNRTISFGAQPLYPPGIDGTARGPFFADFVADVATPCSQGDQPSNVNQSGIVFFPGSMPLYRGGRLVGGLGISGDGVEQDDLVAAAGVTPDFVPPVGIRADRVFVGGIRLPLVKFPRNPER